MSPLKELRIPHMGSVENAKLVSWQITDGAPFREGQVLCEIETDKTVTEVQAEADGLMVRRVAEEGAELKVGDLIAWTANQGASPAQLAEALAGVRPTRSRVTAVGSVRAPVQVVAPAQWTDAARISPRARRLAKEHGVDLSLLSGSATAGRISGDDVLRRSSGSTVESGRLPPELLIPGYAHVPADAVINSTRRKAIARRLAESVRNAPHLTADMQVDLSLLMRARAQLNMARKEHDQGPVSIMSFVSHAASQLLLKHPDLNASFLESHTLLWKVVNLGIAVDTPDGLVVPVIRDAASKSLEEINESIAELAEQARQGTVKQNDLEGGTFTISNPGSLGPVLRAEAILNPPQVAILGLPGIQYVPIAVEANDYRIEVRPILRPSVTFDHRALDGGQVIRFLNDLRAALERPAE